MRPYRERGEKEDRIIIITSRCVHNGLEREVALGTTNWLGSIFLRHKLPSLEVFRAALAVVLNRSQRSAQTNRIMIAYTLGECDDMNNEEETEPTE